MNIVMNKHYIGLVAGVLIIVFSFVVFGLDVNVKAPNIKQSDLYSETEPEFEDDKYYGGDAYTGIQQAAAQAANNTKSLYEAVVAGNIALADHAEAHAKNIESVVITVKTCFGFLLLSMGLLTVVKYSDVFFSDDKKKVVATAPVNLISKATSYTEPKPEDKPTLPADETVTE
jgi:hypothetical protein